MKKLISLLLVLCLSITAMAAFAEEGAGNYLDSHPEAAAFESTWVAEDGDWRIESYAEDDGFRLMIVHKLGDNKEDVWEYAAAVSVSAPGTLTAVPRPGGETSRTPLRTNAPNIMKTAAPNSASTKKENWSGRT